MGNRPLSLIILLLLLLVGNIYAFVKISTEPLIFLKLYPKINLTYLKVIKLIQIFNTISIVGMWYLKKWAIYMALLLSFIVILTDLHFEITHHIYVVLISTLLGVIILFKNWAIFR